MAKVEKMKNERKWSASDQSSRLSRPDRYDLCRKKAFYLAVDDARLQPELRKSCRFSYEALQVRKRFIEAVDLKAFILGSLNQTRSW